MNVRPLRATSEEEEEGRGESWKTDPSPVQREMFEKETAEKESVVTAREEGVTESRGALERMKFEKDVCVHFSLPPPMLRREAVCAEEDEQAEGDDEEKRMLVRMSVPPPLI